MNKPNVCGFGFDGYIREDVDGPGATSQTSDGAGDLEIGLKCGLSGRVSSGV
jgi:hypothetical protein